jgi:FkbM family methyltransferase
MPSSSSATNALWLPNYLKAFGMIRGPALFWRVIQLDRAKAAEARTVIVPGLGGVQLRAGDHDHAIFQQVWIKREYDLAAAAPRQFAWLQEAYRAALARGERPLILDAGAHVGMSVLWWRRTFPKARIVALEPSPRNLAVLRSNVGGLEDVTVLQAALAGAPGKLRIADPAAGGSAVRLGHDGAGEEVPAMTVGQIMAQAGAEELLLAKIDIEGGEADVFSGELGWMDRTHALTVETHDWLLPGEGTSRPLFAAVGARHFDFVAHGENVLLFRAPRAAVN